MKEQNLETHPHITDEQLQEYLDRVLTPLEQDIVEKHLKTCRACQDRADRLQMVFSALDGIPEVLLERDLSPEIVATIRATEISWANGRWLVFLQIAIAMAVLAFSWPLLQRWTAGLSFGDFGFELNRQTARLAETLAVTLSAWATAANEVLPRFLAFLDNLIALSTPGFNPWPWVAGLSVFWLLANGLLLRTARNGTQPTQANGPVER